MLVPAVGMLIFFNEAAIKYLGLSQQFLRDVGSPSVAVGEATLMRLYYLYFGLSAIGLAALLFRMVCPDEVKRSPNEIEFFESESKLPSSQRLRRSVQVLAEAKCSSTAWWTLTDKATREALARFEDIVSDPLHHPSFKEIFLVNGKLVPKFFARKWQENFLPATSSDPDVKRSKSIFEFDLITNEYYVIDSYYPVVRSLVSLLIALGFTLLSIPTLQAFYGISVKMFSGLT